MRLLLQRHCSKIVMETASLMKMTTVRWQTMLIKQIAIVMVSETPAMPVHQMQQMMKIRMTSAEILIIV